MLDPRRPVGLLGLGLAAAVAAWILADRAVLTFPAALFAGTCFALFAFPPSQGMRGRHYLALLMLAVILAVVTVAWQRAWSSSGARRVAFADWSRSAAFEGCADPRGDSVANRQGRGGSR